MKTMIKHLHLFLWLFIIFLWIPIEGFTNQQQTAIQSLKAFFSVSLEKNEVLYMCLGDYSNFIVRVADKTVLFDPSVLGEGEPDILNKKGVDLVVYTHGHWDHFSADIALKLFEGSQPFIAVDPSLTPLLKKDIPDEKLITTASGQSFSAGTVKINTLKGKHIGPIMLFRITINGIKIFHGGDSGYVPLQTMASHLAFVPTGTPSPTCRPEYAFQMISDVKPQIAVPMHGIDSEHDEFKKLTAMKMPDTMVIIPKPYVSQKVSIRLRILFTYNYVHYILKHT